MTLPLPVRILEVFSICVMLTFILWRRKYSTDQYWQFFAEHVYIHEAWLFCCGMGITFVAFEIVNGILKFTH